MSLTKAHNNKTKPNTKMGQAPLSQQTHPASGLARLPKNSILVQRRKIQMVLIKFMRIIKYKKL
ncbi:hypothetical protein GCM10009112_01950 [Marinomonas arenicola]